MSMENVYGRIKYNNVTSQDIPKCYITKSGQEPKLLDKQQYTYASGRPLYFHEIGSKTARRCAAPQPVFTRYKLR